MNNMKEINDKKDLNSLFQNTPIPKDFILGHLGLFMSWQNLSRVLFMNDLYKKILDIQGIVCEFGVFWGQNMALFESFRSIYEPYNYTRKIVGFDTFKSTIKINETDSSAKITEKDTDSAIKDYDEYLDQILQCHENLSQISDLKKYELVKGDASKTIKKYLTDNPETIIAFAYFDFDVYEPTKICLEEILPFLTKGAIIAFEQLNVNKFNAETKAFDDVLGRNRYKIHRSRNYLAASYIVYE